MPAHQREDQPRQGRRLPHRVPARWASTVLVPDVNVSDSDFVAVLDPTGATAGSIPFGLSAVRNVGEGLVGLIVAERDANGPFVDFYDFCDRVDLSVLNKRTIESLIKAGGFDSLGHPRQGLLLAYEQIIDQTVARRRKEAEGQFDLFSTWPTTAPTRRRVRRTRVRDPRRRVRQEASGSPSRRRCSASTSATIRCMGAEAALRRRTECTHRRARGRRGRHRRARSAAWSPPCSASGPRRATSWPSSCSRTCRPRSR